MRNSADLFLGDWPYNFITQTIMISLGASLKRKSISKVEPTLPKPKNIR